MAQPYLTYGGLATEEKEKVNFKKSKKKREKSTFPITEEKGPTASVLQSETCSPPPSENKHTYTEASDFSLFSGSRHSLGRVNVQTDGRTNGRRAGGLRAQIFTARLPAAGAQTVPCRATTFPYTLAGHLDKKKPQRLRQGKDPVLKTTSCW